MALTKVTGQVINTSTDVTVGVLTVTNTLAVGGTVSIGGTLTYEDVTNIDSVGLITARNGIVVGSGITLSKDGDVFFTGIATGNGSGLTNLPAANLTGTLPAISGANLTNLDASDLASGTVPTARLGSGTASSSTFLRGDSTFATVTSTTINNNADNRVITGSGTANTLEAESNVNISGGILIAGHTASTTVSDGEGPFIQVKSTDSRGGISLLRHSADAAGGGIYIGKSRNATIGSNTVLQNGDELGRITFSGDDGTDIHTQSAAIQAFVDGTTGSNDMPGSLRLYTNSGAGSGSSDLTERVRIDSSGNVSIGGIAPVATASYYNKASLHIHQTGSGSATGAQIHLTSDYTGSAAGDGSQLSIYSSSLYINNQENGSTYFYNNGSATATILANGNFGVNTQAPSKKLHVNGDILATSIFLGGTGSDNQLDDYEEGSFTVTQGGTSIGGYSEQHGRYVKVGKMVTINIRLQSSANTSSGNFKLHGLPFTSASSSGDVYGSGGITYCDIPLNKKSFDPYIGSNSTDVQFYEKTTGTGVSLNSNYSNGYMGLAAIYYVD